MANAATQVEKTTLRQREALEALAATLVAHGDPAGAPFARYAVPSLPSLPALLVLDPETTAGWGIAIVHAHCRQRTPSVAVTDAVKRVGNAARAVRKAHALAQAKKAQVPAPPRSATRLAA